MHSRMLTWLAEYGPGSPGHAWIWETMCELIISEHGVIKRLDVFASELVFTSRWTTVHVRRSLCSSIKLCGRLTHPVVCGVPFSFSTGTFFRWREFFCDEKSAKWQRTSFRRPWWSGRFKGRSQRQDTGRRRYLISEGYMHCAYKYREKAVEGTRRVLPFLGFPTTCWAWAVNSVSSEESFVWQAPGWSLTSNGALFTWPVLPLAHPHSNTCGNSGRLMLPGNPYFLHLLDHLEKCICAIHGSQEALSATIFTLVQRWCTIWQAFWLGSVAPRDWRDITSCMSILKWSDVGQPYCMPFIIIQPSDLPIQDTSLFWTLWRKSCPFFQACISWYNQPQLSTWEHASVVDSTMCPMLESEEIT